MTDDLQHGVFFITDFFEDAKWTFVEKTHYLIFRWTGGRMLQVLDLRDPAKEIEVIEIPEAPQRLSKSAEKAFVRLARIYCNSNSNMVKK